MMQALHVVVAGLALAVLCALSADPARADGANGGSECSMGGEAAASGDVIRMDFRPDGQRPVIVPAAGRPAPAPLPAGTVDGLEAVRSKVNAINAQVKSLETRLSRPDWQQAVQSQLGTLRGTQAALQQDVSKLQAANRSANLAEGIRLSNNLHSGVSELGKVIHGLGQARDAASARGLLTKISVSLDGIIKNVSDEPLCCALRTCCYVGIR
jgi:hypothetical protein